MSCSALFPMPRASPFPCPGFRSYSRLSYRAPRACSSATFLQAARRNFIPRIPFAMNKKICLRFTLVFLLLICAAPRAARAQEAANPPDTSKLTLRQALTLAMQNSRELALARVQYTVALNAAGVDRADFLPNLYTGSGAAYTSGFPATPGGSAPALFSLSYTQTLFNLPLRGQLKAAEDRAKSQKLELDRTRDAVIVRTATAYLELAKIRHSLELLRSEQAGSEKIGQVTRERAQAGQELPIEVTRSELTAARIRERVIKLEDRDVIVSEQIRNLTGIPDAQSIGVDTEEPAFAAIRQDNGQQESELMSLALQSDPLLREDENERKAREDLWKGAKSDSSTT